MGKFLSLFRKKARSEQKFICLLGFLRARIPALDEEKIAKGRAELLRKILPTAEFSRDAELLDAKISGKKKIHTPTALLDFLALLAKALRELPKVLPRVAWRERVRERFTSFPIPFFVWLRKASAYALLLVFLGTVVLSGFVVGMQTTYAKVAQVSVDSGVVKLRQADATFFTPIENEAVVRVGDAIRVEKDSQARMKFADDSEMILGEKTEVAIKDFKSNFLSLQKKKEVKVALLEGAIQTKVVQTEEFSVETPRGNIASQEGEFSVKVDKTTGKTEVNANDRNLEIVSNVDASVVSLNEGDKAVFDEGKVVLGRADKDADLALWSVKDLATEIEIIQIHAFDTLIAYQDRRTGIAQKIATGNEEALAHLLDSFDAENLDEFALAIQEDYPASGERSSALASLNKLELVERILTYYANNPKFLQGQPEFELLAQSKYYPPAYLSHLFAALRAKDLAYSKVQGDVDNLITILSKELTADLSKSNLVINTKNLLSEMGEEAVYLYALEQIQAVIPSKVRALVEAKIEGLEKRVEAYIGSQDQLG